MKRLRCKKEYGEWYYVKVKGERYGSCVVEFDTYELYNKDKEYVNTFGFYNDMKYYIETGIVI